MTRSELTFKTFYRSHIIQMVSGQKKELLSIHTVNCERCVRFCCEDVVVLLTGQWSVEVWCILTASSLQQTRQITQISRTLRPSLFSQLPERSDACNVTHAWRKRTESVTDASNTSKEEIRSTLMYISSSGWAELLKRPVLKARFFSVSQCWTVQNNLTEISNYFKIFL